MQGVESNTTTHLSHAIVKASSLEPSPREYGAGGTYFPRSYSYNMPATDDAVAEHQGLGAPGASQQPKRHRRTQSLDPRLSIHSGDSSGTPRTARLSQAGRSGSLQTVKHRISLALHRGSQVWPPQHDMLSCLIACNESLSPWRRALSEVGICLYWSLLGIQLRSVSICPDGACPPLNASYLWISKLKPVPLCSP